MNKNYIKKGKKNGIKKEYKVNIKKKESKINEKTKYTYKFLAILENLISYIMCKNHRNSNNPPPQKKNPYKW